MKSWRWCQPNCWEVDGDFVDPGNPVVLILIKHRQVRILLPMKTFPSFLARTGCLKRIAQQSGFISDAERFVILFGVLRWQAVRFFGGRMLNQAFQVVIH